MSTEADRHAVEAAQYQDAQLARQALQGRLVEISIELRRLPKTAIRRALEHERHMICEELQTPHEGRME